MSLIKNSDADQFLLTWKEAYDIVLNEKQIIESNARSNFSYAQSHVSFPFGYIRSKMFARTDTKLLTVSN